MYPYFSIIIPTLNEEVILPKILDSLLQQKNQNFEIIIVDGNSLDKTLQIANKYKKLFLKLHIELTIITSPKQNVSAQRNTGSKIAKGEYLAFFDADVIIPDNYLSIISEKIYNTGSPLVTTWMKPENNHIFEKLVFLFLNLVVEYGKYINKPMLFGSNIIIKKQVFNQIGKFRSDIIIAEDQELAQRALHFHYSALVLRNPKMTHSSRRYNKNGYFKTTLMYLKATIYLLIHGPVTKNVVDYPMGGKAHE